MIVNLSGSKISLVDDAPAAAAHARLNSTDSTHRGRVSASGRGLSTFPQIGALKLIVVWVVSVDRSTDAFPEYLRSCDRLGLHWTVSLSVTILNTIYLQADKILHYLQYFPRKYFHFMCVKFQFQIHEVECLMWYVLYK